MDNDISKVYLEGKTVILSAEYWQGDEEARTFLCEGGFGCAPGARGTGVFGTFVSDGESTRVERYQILRLVG